MNAHRGFVCKQKKITPEFKVQVLILALFSSSSSLSILVPLWFIIISLVFFYLSKLLFSGFLQFKGNFVQSLTK